MDYECTIKLRIECIGGCILKTSRIIAKQNNNTLHRCAKAKELIVTTLGSHFVARLEKGNCSITVPLTEDILKNAIKSSTPIRLEGVTQLQKAALLSNIEKLA